MGYDDLIRWHGSRMVATEMSTRWNIGLSVDAESDITWHLGIMKIVTCQMVCDDKKKTHKKICTMMI